MKKIHIITILSILLTSCISTSSYMVSSDYRSYELDSEIVSVEQWTKSSVRGSTSIAYSDEFFYDDEGNIIKHIFSENISIGYGTTLIEFDLRYKMIGGYMVPATIAINGELYFEITYEILPVENSGIIIPWEKAPSYSRLNTTSSGAIYSSQDWIADVSRYYVYFLTDGMFVVDQQYFSSDVGFYNNKSLTMGFNNIVVKEVIFSTGTISSVINRLYYSSYPSYYSGNSNWSEPVDSRDENSVYEPLSETMTPANHSRLNYEWEVIAGKIVLMSIRQKDVVDGSYTVFRAEYEYNALGERIHEIWFLKNSDVDGLSIDEKVIFEQTLTY